MDTLTWIIETATGYMFLCWAASLAIDSHYYRTREHRWGRQHAGPDWRAMVWPPAYAAWVRRAHDEIDARHRVIEPVQFEKRPRCPFCGLPHSLVPGDLPVVICERIRARAEKERGGNDGS
jgi:hypothetical protein